MKKLLLILILIFLPTTALADFSVKFENTSDEKMYYLFYWVDHPFDQAMPVHMAGGELEALESIDIGINFKPGKYYVIWRDQGSLEYVIPVNLDDMTRTITITPEKAILVLSI